MMFIFRIAGLVQYVTGVNKNVVGYVSDWVAEDGLPFDKLTHINYAFGLMLKGYSSIHIEEGQKERMQKVIQAARGKCKTLFSIGGWAGSQTFSTMANHNATVDMFIDDALNYLREDKGYGFDGLDINWEYPGVRLGSKCNFNSTSDTKNYLKLLQRLRTRMDKEFKGSKLLTAAVRVITFDNENSVPLRDMKEFAKVFDFVNIMAYDIMGAWSNKTGPNAPIYSLEDSGVEEVYEETQLSLATAVRDWTNAGFPPCKLNAGIALYGRVTATLKTPTGFLEEANGVVPRGDGVDLQSIDGYCGEELLFKGVYRYKNLRKDILINAYNEARPGFIRKFDTKTKTPYIIDEANKQFISYEDLDSTRVKIDFINKKGLGGAMVWDLSMDYNNEILDALQAIRPKENFEPNQETPESRPPLLPLSPKDGEIFLSGTCQSPQSTCANKEISPIYNLCHEHNWLQKSCPKGTVCTHVRHSIMCAKPTSQALPSPDLGKPCQSGPTRCTDTLKSPAYLQCNSKTWIKRECPTDQVCVNTPDAISCIKAPKTIETSKAGDIVLQGECALDAKHTCVNVLNSKFYNHCENYAWTQHSCQDEKVCQSTETGITCIQPYTKDTSENPNLPKGLCEEDTEYCFAPGQDPRFSRCYHHSWQTLKCPHICFQNNHRTFCDNPSKSTR